jgi:hypothetical protein
MREAALPELEARVSREIFLSHFAGESTKRELLIIGAIS